jgi:hypothetical protein
VRARAETDPPASKAGPSVASSTLTGSTGLARLVAQQTVDAFIGVTRLPPPNGGAADARASRNFCDRQTLGRKQDDLSALDMLSRAVAVGDNGEQTLTIRRGQGKDVDSLSHCDRLAHPAFRVNLPIASVH